ncbi:hypothetical protein TGRH88_042560 [Toxoplasma gondii]|uniref:Uncharacterized protein n=1 Tax=Toxoplasma gondii TaxID=5811 RepID=A0A7J6K1S5_TOXGO|nr:hypothetical protein TGRH88_042560 [Toxoplasma gondii]
MTFPITHSDEPVGAEIINEQCLINFLLLQESRGTAKVNPRRTRLTAPWWTADFHAQLWGSICTHTVPSPLRSNAPLVTAAFSGRRRVAAKDAGVVPKVL